VKAYTRFQDPKSGLWYQVVNKGHLPENWLETSSSSMYTYTISMAVKRGYVDKSYMSAAKKGYQGVLTKISLDTDGMTNLADICEGTNVADIGYYFARNRNLNDFHGLGAFLIMNEHMMTKGAPRLLLAHHSGSSLKSDFATPITLSSNTLNKLLQPDFDVRKAKGMTAGKHEPTKSGPSLRVSSPILLSHYQPCGVRR
jgi:hypothetical protein